MRDPLHMIIPIRKLTRESTLLKKTIYGITFARKLILLTMSREEEEEIDNRSIIIPSERPLIVDNSQSIIHEEEEGGREYFCFLGISMTI